jgi:Family of unknown function (DUF6062)
MTKPTSYYDLKEAFAEAGCAVCRLLRRDVDRYLGALLYENVLEREVHAAFRAMRGLCNTHAWQLKEYRGNAVGIAVLYRAVVDEALKEIDKQPLSAPRRRLRLGPTSAEDKRGAALAEMLTAQQPCSACQQLDRYEQTYLAVFEAHLTEAAFREAFAASAGLCLPHFRVALQRMTDSAHLPFVIDTQRAAWQRLRAELELFYDKHNHDRRAEAMGSEADSWLRSLGAMSGEPNVFGLRRQP